MLLINALLGGCIFFGSFSMRTPKQNVGIDDYEISTGLKSDNYYINRQWERELGEKYIDDEIWYLYEKGFIYIKPQYVNKTSKDLQYFKTDARLLLNYLSLGLTMRTTDEWNTDKRNLDMLFSFGMKDKGIWGPFEAEASFEGYYNKINIEKEVYMIIRYPIDKKISLFGMLDYKDIKAKEDYKFKVGFEIKL